MGPNLGWLFYRELYAHGADSTHIDQTMTHLLNANGTDEAVNAPHGFKLETIYPGLLVGSGYPHGVSDDKDAKIGFYFDHTSGLPVIPGSSVKGVLRHLFGLPFGKQTDPHAEAKAEMIRDILGKKEIDVAKLARAIFEGEDPGDPQKRLPVYRRDRFFDARIVKTSGRVLADDYITPHKEALKNPVPIRFIKVPPGVTFAFVFALNDTDLGEGCVVTAKEKLILFEYLLGIFGIGAKSRVGYGQFRFDKTPQELREEVERRSKRERIQKVDSPFEKIMLELENIKAPKTLVKKVKEIAEELNEKESTALREKIIDQGFDPKDKFVKRALNALKSQE